MDPSVSMTKSVQSLSTAAPNKISNSGLSTALDPLYDKITEVGILPKFIYYIILIFICIQSFAVATWDQLNDKLWESNPASKEISKVVHYLGFFRPELDSDDNILTAFLIDLLLYIATFSCLAIQIAIFRKKRKFNKKSLYFTRFLLELIPMVLTIPLSDFSGSLFLKLTIEKDVRGLTICYFLLGILEYITMTWFAFYSITICSISPYFSPSAFTSFKHQPYVTFLTIPAIFHLISKIAQFFPVWIEDVVILVHGVFMALHVFYFSRAIFLKMHLNVVFMAISIASIIIDFIRFLCNLIPSKNGLVFYILAFVFVVLSPIASFIFFHLQAQKLRKKLIFFNEDGSERTDIPSEEERLERLFVLGLDSKEQTALQYLDFIVKNNLHAYMDFFIYKFILQYHHSLDSLCHCLRILICIPSNDRNINKLYPDAVRHRDMNFSHRFLLNQIQRIKYLRQSSSSSKAGERLKELKNTTKDIEASFQNYWLATEIDPGFYYGAGCSLSQLRSLFDESISEFPNSIEYREENAHFLIECESDFVEAIKNKHKIEMIEAGHNYNSDACFRQFIQSFPQYLKKGVIDLKGNMIINRKATQNKGSSSQSSSHSSSNANDFTSSSSSSNSDLEVAVEEEIGKILMTDSKLRVALQRVTETRSADFHIYLLLSIFAIFFLGFVISIFIFAYFDGYFDSRMSTTERIKKINQARMYMFQTDLMVAYFWSNTTGALQDYEYFLQINKEDGDRDINSFMPTSSFQDRSMQFTILAKHFYEDFLVDIAEQSLLGYNVYTFAPPLFEETTLLQFVDVGIPCPAKYYNLKTVMIYMFMTQRLLISEGYNQTLLTNWYINSTRFGTMYMTLQNITDSYDHITDSLTLMSIQDAQNAEKIIKIIQYLFPILYAIGLVALFVGVSYFYLKEIKTFSEMLINLPSKIKKEAMQPIRRITNSNQEKQEAVDTGKNNASRSIIFYTFIIIVSVLLIGNAVLIAFQIRNIDFYNEQFNYLNQWSADSRIRKSYVTQLCLWINQAIILPNPLCKDTLLTNIGLLRYLIEKDAELLSAATKSMLEDEPEYPAGSEVDDEIDRLTLNRQCQPDPSFTSFHSLYYCASVQNLLNFFLNVVDQVLAKLDQYEGYISEEIPCNLLHLSNNHLIPKLLEIDERWTDVADIFNHRYSNNHILFLVFELIIEVIIFIFGFILLNIFDVSYNTVMILLRKVGPASIVATEDLLNYLLAKVSKSSRSGMSLEQGIVYNSIECIVFISPDGIIDNINPSVQKSIGYSPDQLLGQSISVLFDADDDSRKKIVGQLELMRNKQSPPTYEDHLTVLSDDGHKIPYGLTIITIFNNNDDISSFAFILRDESELAMQQTKAEEAKKTSESLLYQILPRSIVVRLNQGEKDISFTVESATIMFIDIVKFSEYAATLTPQEIMKNLSLIFAGFDELIINYELITKIKLIGDVYMCASGLFSPDIQPIEHAEQMTKFALKCLQSLNETNVKLNSNLEVRIGINSGGPLIAGVLGVDKPTFDIIGDPINVSSRLQSTDIPGQIQISQSTYDLINSLDFSIRPRGEVFLKGKGKQMAYIVSNEETTPEIEE